MPERNDEVLLREAALEEEPAGMVMPEGPRRG
jgi:hypothetical protein